MDIKANQLDFLRKSYRIHAMSVRTSGGERQYYVDPAFETVGIISIVASVAGASFLILKGHRERNSLDTREPHTPQGDRESHTQRRIVTGRDQPSGQRRGIERGAPSGKHRPQRT